MEFTLSLTDIRMWVPESFCGEGIPDFYAKQALANGSWCLGETVDKYLSYAYSLSGFCKSIESYGFRKDKDGNPLIEDC